MSVLFHADVGFSPSERAFIGTAAALLTAESLGQVQVKVLFDVDFRDVALITRLQNAPMLLRLDLLDPKISIADGQHKVQVLGWTAIPRAFVIPERSPDARVFIHVVMHEMLHDLGVGHVPDPDAIMYHAGSPSLWLTEMDWAAIDEATRLTSVPTSGSLCTCPRVLGPKVP